MVNDPIVFTNGCFDILHTGHVSYLAQARDMGKRLVVGVNTDASVSKLKGPDRPINRENDRALLLASLQVVDLIVLFGDETPIDLIKKIEPDVLVKGGDYSATSADPSDPKYIVGSNEVRAKGGKVETITFVDGFSTTGIIEKMKK